MKDYPSLLRISADWLRSSASFYDAVAGEIGDEESRTHLLVAANQVREKADLIIVIADKIGGKLAADKGRSGDDPEQARDQEEESSSLRIEFPEFDQEIDPEEANYFDCKGSRRSPPREDESDGEGVLS